MKHKLIGLSVLTIALAAGLSSCETEWEPVAHYGYPVHSVYYNPYPFRPIYGPGPVISWNQIPRPNKPALPSNPGNNGNNKPSTPNQNTGRPPMANGGQSFGPNVSVSPIPPQTGTTNQGRPPVSSRH